VTSSTPGRTATPAGTPHIVTYVVKKGDDVYGIARHFSVTPALIISANDLKDPSKIKIGQALHIPVVAAVAP
jgi:LysM repeat protein